MSLWPFELDTVEHHCAVENFLTEEECNQIIEKGKKKKLEEAVTFAGKDPIRESYVTWLFGDKDLAWLFKRITDVSIQANNKCFNFDLIGLGEGLQFTYYKAPNGKYGKHTDCGPNANIRKLSFVIQLSNPSSYEGGDLALHFSEEPLTIPKKLGTICFFPSYILHEVTKIIKGERYSLVGWITGPKFK